MKKLINNCLPEIGIAAVLASIFSIAYEVSNGGVMERNNYFFTKMVIGCLVIGIGWGAPRFLYEDEKRSGLQSGLIHILIGCSVMLVTSYLAGWIPVQSGLSIILMVIGIQIAISLIIFWVSYRNNKRLASQMNDRLRQMNKISGKM